MPGEAVATEAEECYTRFRDSARSVFVSHDVVAHAPERFAGTMAAGSLGTVQVARIRSAAHVVRRPAEHIDASDTSYLKITLQLSGAARVTQRGTQELLAPGDVLLYDTEVPYEIDYPGGYDAMVAMVPRKHLAVQRHAVAGLGLRRMGPGLGRSCFVSLLREVGYALGDLDAQEARAVGDSLLDFVRLSLRPDRPGADPRQHDGLREAIVAFVEDNLADTTLTPTAIADAHHISLSLLHGVFRAGGSTVSAHIRGRRLEVARRRLQDPGYVGSSITGIAQGVGFTDPAHFSRLYRARYGIAPTMERRQVCTDRQGPSSLIQD